MEGYAISMVGDGKSWTVGNHIRTAIPWSASSLGATKMLPQWSWRIDVGFRVTLMFSPKH